MPAPPMQIVTPPKHYPRANACIYCGRKGTERSREHIIPFGLAANSLVLPSAACPKCRGETHEAEQHCMRRMWWPFRVQAGVPSRDKEPTDRFNLRQARVTRLAPDGGIEAYEKVSETVLTVDEFPLYFTTYRFPPPGMLIGRDPNISVGFELWSLHSEERLRRFVQNDKDAISLGPGQPEPFLRMIAKIAHGYAIAELGAASFEPLLAQFILGDPCPAASYVGGEIENPPAEPSLHRIGIRIETIGMTSFVVVDLRLFCFLGTPLYRIVVGRLHGAADKVEPLKQAFHAIDIQEPPPLGELIPLVHFIGPAGSKPLDFK